MGTILTGVLDIIPVADGSQAFPTLDVEGALSQSYSGTTYFPDWKTQSALRPKLTPRCYDGVEGSTIEYGFVAGIATSAGQASTANQQWYYNGLAIYWTRVGSSNKYRSANYLSADGTTPLLELDYSDTAHPWVTFIGNIPTDLSRGDDDIIRFVGKVDGIDDFTIEAERNVRISELVGGTGNKLDLILSKTSFDNDSNTNDSISVNVGAVINGAYVVGFSAINATGYKVSFADSIGINTLYFRAGDTTVPSSVQSLTLLPSYIGGMGVMIGKLLDANDGEAATASEKIRDLGDPDIVTIENFTVASAGSTTKIKDREGSIKKGEYLRCVAKVTNRTGETDKTSSYYWKSARILNKAGQNVTAETAKITGADGNPKVYVVDYATAFAAGGFRFACEATDEAPSS